MKKIIGIMGSVILIFTGCVTDRHKRVPHQLSSMFRKEPNCRLGLKRLTETQKIAGTDEVREFCEEKSMQKVTTQETTLTFRGDIREFDIKDNKAVSALDVRNAPKLEVLYCAGNSQNLILHKIKS
ncbi:MAG: hypothetical protein P1P63_05360 [Treponemataceae bacterium]